MTPHHHRWKRRGPRHAQVHFPPLTGHEALLLANLFDRAIAALWRAHGDAMADLIACCDENYREQVEQVTPDPADDIF